MHPEPESQLQRSQPVADAPPRGQEELSPCQHVSSGSNRSPPTCGAPASPMQCTPHLHLLVPTWGEDGHFWGVSGGGEVLPWKSEKGPAGLASGIRWMMAAVPNSVSNAEHPSQPAPQRKGVSHQSSPPRDGPGQECGLKGVLQGSAQCLLSLVDLG